MVKRLIQLRDSRSLFLFGARGTGKTTLLRERFSEKQTYFIDLLNATTMDELLLDPSSLDATIQALAPRIKWVVIDEVQKLPILLDTVHRWIELSKAKKRPLKFVLTGSSARKLKRGAANLLAGRASIFHLFPLTHVEWAGEWQLADAMTWGALPEVISIADPLDRRAFLEAYAQTYLKEEVWEEHLVRKLRPFRKFLEVAAQSNGDIINYSNIARDVGADVTTVQSYFQLLEDTLVGILLEPFHESVRKRQRSNPRFYFFDIGVQRALARHLTTPVEPHTYGFGRIFEHFIILEIYRLQSYLQKDYALSYLTTKDGAEIDLIIDRPGKKRVLIEIKSTHRVTEHDVRHLIRFTKDIRNSEALCLSLDPTPKQFENVRAVPWQMGFQELDLIP